MDPRPHSEHLRNVAGLGRVGEVLAGKSHSSYTVVSILPEFRLELHDVCKFCPLDNI